MLEGHKKRAEKVRGYLAKNKAVTLIAVLAAIAVLVNLVSKYQTKEQTDSEPETVQTADENWRFYPVDLIVLGAGGGLYTVMMLQEKRRAKEDLN